ncbi:hypothetical protein AMS59_12515 [Lysinibacillus sp. FJAT-14745]|uniref:DUF3888 domain-containing protein n=1 Tax=Lysinibacillus sp. FJAT-14745 TaxID=1704289 RepID=UPI0006ABE173|nr:DUF3888 domain-containing protein [Lysinibacillus sp. FJAT-14745]KOP78640.1 hypothetical protein AMS59_12515 [Lysinibacillus sp. FJAT-14745]
MKKIKIVSLLLLSLLIINSAFAKSDIEYLPQDQPPSILELAFLRELGPSILEAMSTHGKMQLFTSGRIEKIQRNIQEDYYDVTLRALGYEGPINPPYSQIRITFRIPAGDFKNKNKVISYEAKNITPEEFKKLSEFTN